MCILFSILYSYILKNDFPYCEINILFCHSELVEESLHFFILYRYCPAELVSASHHLFSPLEGIVGVYSFQDSISLIYKEEFPFNYRILNRPFNN